MNACRLVKIIREEHRNNNYVSNFVNLLLFLSSSHAFWTKVRIESEASYLMEIAEQELNMNMFYEHGESTLFTDSIVSDGETFYCHCAKHHMPGITKDILKELGCVVGV